MENMTTWTVIYDNGWEDVRVKATPDNCLNWAYCDQAGSLEEISWKSGTRVRDLLCWLDEHRISASSYQNCRNTSCWEKILSDSLDTDVSHLIETSREMGVLAL